MIKEFEFYHGIVFSRLLHSTQEAVSIKPFSLQDNAAYVINDKIGVYIKYSTKRLSPWRFSFLKRHQDLILEMKNKVGAAYLLLVCNEDGVVAISFDELKKILNETHDDVEWISASRGKREMYSIKGSDGSLEFKIGKDDFPDKLFKEPTSSFSSKIFSWFSE
jgi:hypothetical protein